MRKVMAISVMGLALALGGCASGHKPEVKEVAKPVPSKSEFQKKKRINVKLTVNELLNYCETWAKAYEANLGKDPVEAFNECVALTADNMQKEGNKRMNKKDKASVADFPFSG